MDKLPTRDELAMSAPECDLFDFEFKELLVDPKIYGSNKAHERIRTRQQARYAYADAMIAARKSMSAEDGDKYWRDRE